MLGEFPTKNMVQSLNLKMMAKSRKEEIKQPAGFLHLYDNIQLGP